MSAMPTKTMMTVPLLDLKAQYADIRQDVDDAVRRVMESTRFIGGPEGTGLGGGGAPYSQCPFGIGRGPRPHPRPPPRGAPGTRPRGRVGGPPEFFLAR